jgi:hypothetical protein
MEFPGGRVPFTRELAFVGGALGPTDARLPAFRMLSSAGAPLPGISALAEDLDRDTATALYVAMARLQVMDTICYDAQRQVRMPKDGGGGEKDTHTHTHTE